MSLKHTALGKIPMDLEPSRQEETLSGALSSVGATVMDSKRFADTGGWGYFGSTTLSQSCLS
ncbi:MAG: hypothetical protein E6Q98_25265 [Rhodospirillaceae bacterium]|nr:MAG: hypothetical protein E6Q98_25265 [Rhodospirillaceae bacterium]